MRRLRVATICVALLIGTASPALADSRDIDTFALAFFPCLVTATDASVPPTPQSGANDGAFAHICFVNFGGIPGDAHPSWQAATGEWILFRASAGVFATATQCEAAAAALVVIETLDGVDASVDRSCLQAPFGSVLSLRMLARPLPPGAHTASLSVTVEGDGTVDLTQTVTVAPQG